MNAKSQSPFKVNLHELPRRAGEMRENVLDFAAPESIGVPLLRIPSGTSVAINFKAESVDDGVLITGQVKSHAQGECGRCLDAIDFPVEQRFQELFLYTSRKPEGPDQDVDIFLLEGDIADLEIAVRDAVILSMPVNPICTPDCKGLCPRCGEKWSELPQDHSHEIVDPRWSGLAGWDPNN
jgi:uncharacterized protein